MIHKIVSKNVEERTGVCQVCGPVKLYKKGNSLSCAVKNYQKSRKYKKKIEYASQLESQDGRCAICRETMQTPHWDHDHATGEFRGWLCFRCNSGLGQFRDNPEFLMAAIAYLGASC